MTIVLTPGQAREASVFPRLLGQGAVKRPGRGQPRRVVGDKGSSSRSIHMHCRRRGIRYTIPRRTNECRIGPFDRSTYRLCHRIENLIAHCTQYRSLATRYDRRRERPRALWTIVCIIARDHPSPNHHH